MTEKNNKVQNLNKSIKINGLDVDLPGQDKSGWVVIKQQSFTIDKREFILERYNQDFPENKIDDYNLFEGILTRSKVLKDWYARVSLEYADNIQLPVAYKDLIKPDEYKDAFHDINEYNTNLAESSAEIEILSKKFAEDVEDINRRCKEKNLHILNKNKLYRILLLNGSELPISIQLEIQRFTPKDGDQAQERRTYAKELLINYKIALIKKLQSDEDLDIDALIEANMTK